MMRRVFSSTLIAVSSCVLFVYWLAAFSTVFQFLGFTASISLQLILEWNLGKDFTLSSALRK
jgi:hypothetical protein